MAIFGDYGSEQGKIKNSLLSQANGQFFWGTKKHPENVDDIRENGPLLENFGYVTSRRWYCCPRGSHKPKNSPKTPFFNRKQPQITNYDIYTHCA